jgi:hypothetical protein
MVTGFKSLYGLDSSGWGVSNGGLLWTLWWPFGTRLSRREFLHLPSDTSCRGRTSRSEVVQLCILKRWIYLLKSDMADTRLNIYVQCAMESFSWTTISEQFYSLPANWFMNSVSKWYWFPLGTDTVVWEVSVMLWCSVECELERKAVYWSNLLGL